MPVTAVRDVAPSETGLAAALLNTGQQLGGALGLSVLATVAIDATSTKVRALSTNGHGASSRVDPSHCHCHRLHLRARSRRWHRAIGAGDLGHRYPSPS